MQDYTVSCFNKTVLILVYKGFFLTLPLISQFCFVVDTVCSINETDGLVWPKWNIW